MTSTQNIENMIEFAYGSFMGSLCGDAAGASLEFIRKKITEEMALAAMYMPGGGALQVGSGQFTDDSELAISLANALYKKDPSKGVPIEDIAKRYTEWFESHPFDMGGTCSRAFSCCASNYNSSISNRMMKIAIEYSFVSEANGALMRIVPMAIWSVNQKENVIAHNAKLDAMLSHPNQICQDCNAIIVLIVTYLIKHPHDNEGAINYIEDYIFYNIKSKVKEWFIEDSLDITNLDCTSNIGHVKWGFLLAIYFLRNNTSFEEAIKQTLMKGGDTDTNAAIVGGVIGALHGINGIPEYMKNPVLEFDPENPGERKGYKRPAMYNASSIYKLVYGMLL